MKLGTTLYVVRRKVDLTKGEKKVRYYGVPKTTGQVSTEELAEAISVRCSLTRADVLAAVSALSDVMQGHLRDGKTVRLDRIGLFSVSASSVGVESPEECTPAKMKAGRICFKAAKEMRLILGEIEYVPAVKYKSRKKEDQ